MKILFLIDRLCTPGGAERQLVTLARALRARGHECTIAALFAGSDLASDLPAWDVGFHELNVRSRHNFVDAAVRAARLIHKDKFDVVHAHLLSSCIASGLSRVLAASPARVVVLHNLDYEIHPAKTIRQKTLRLVHRFALRRLTDGVVAVSESVAHHYRNEMGIRHITAISNPIELGSTPETFLAGRERLRRNLGLDAGTDLLACSARMVKQKGHFLLLRTVEILRSRGLAPKVMLIGSGPLEPAIRAAVNSAGLEDQVIMTGNLPHSEALRYTAAADVFVSPSSQEGFGLAIAEAMALGVPVVAVAVGAVPEVIEEEISGLLVPPADPVALANNIAHVLKDRDLRQRLRAAAPERIQNNFTPAVIAERWEIYLGELIARRLCRTLGQERAPASTEFQSNG